MRFFECITEMENASLARQYAERGVNVPLLVEKIIDHPSHVGFIAHRMLTDASLLEFNWKFWQRNDEPQQAAAEPAQPAQPAQPPQPAAEEPREYRQVAVRTIRRRDPKDGKMKYWKNEGSTKYLGGNPQDPRSYWYEAEDDYNSRQPWFQKQQSIKQAEAAFKTLQQTLGPDYTEVLDALKRALEDWMAGQDKRQTKWSHVDNYIGGQAHVQGSEDGRKRLQQDLWRDIDDIRGSGQFQGSQTYDADVYKAAIRRRKMAELMGQSKYD